MKSHDSAGSLGRIGNHIQRRYRDGYHILRTAKAIERYSPQRTPRTQRMKIRIGLAAPRIALSIDEGILKVRSFLANAAEQEVQIVCFPESYIPGLRGQDFEVPLYDKGVIESALKEICQAAKQNSVTT